MSQTRTEFRGEKAASAEKPKGFERRKSQHLRTNFVFGDERNAVARAHRNLETNYKSNFTWNVPKFDTII